MGQVGRIRPRERLARVSGDDKQALSRRIAVIRAIDRRQHVLGENVSDVEGFCPAQDVPRAGAALVVFRSATPRLAEVNELWTGDGQIEPAPRHNVAEADPFN